MSIVHVSVLSVSHLKYTQIDIVVKANKVTTWFLHHDFTTEGLHNYRVQELFNNYSYKGLKWLGDYCIILDVVVK